jgi:hypothetical protein
MRTKFRKYAWSFAVALTLTVLVGAVSGVPRLSAVGVLAPGMLGAAMLFPEGIHSNWANTYLVIAGLMNAFFLTWPVSWLWTLISRAH